MNLRRLVAAMRQQPVVPHADAEHARDVVQNQRGEHRPVVDVEEGRYGADMKPGHGDRGNHVHAGLMLSPVHEHRCRH